MKKISLIILMIVLFAGCSSTKEDTKPKEELGYNKDVLEAKLLEYGKMVYDNDTWLKGGIEPLTYYMTLKEMSERNNYDISMFVNTKTKKPCDPENTKIEFIVSTQTKEGETNYKYNPVLDCD